MKKKAKKILKKSLKILLIIIIVIILFVLADVYIVKGTNFKELSNSKKDRKFKLEKLEYVIPKGFYKSADKPYEYDELDKCVSYKNNDLNKIIICRLSSNKSKEKIDEFLLENAYYHEGYTLDRIKSSIVNINDNYWYEIGESYHKQLIYYTATSNDNYSIEVENFYNADNETNKFINSLKFTEKLPNNITKEDYDNKDTNMQKVIEEIENYHFKYYNLLYEIPSSLELKVYIDKLQLETKNYDFLEIEIKKIDINKNLENNLENYFKACNKYFYFKNGDIEDDVLTNEKIGNKDWYVHDDSSSNYNRKEYFYYSGNRENNYMIEVTSKKGVNKKPANEFLKSIKFEE